MPENETSGEAFVERGVKRRIVCAWCGVRCGGCRVQREAYCGLNCQRHAWVDHRRACEIARRVLDVEVRRIIHLFNFARPKATSPLCPRRATWLVGRRLVSQEVLTSRSGMGGGVRLGRWLFKGRLPLGK